MNQLEIAQVEQTEAVGVKCGCILIVDDDDLLLEVERKMLERMGYEVVATSSGTVALQEFHTDPYRFDLVLSDICMPHFTGVDLARMMLAVRNELRIVLCTGFSEWVDEEEAKSLGITEYLMKPFTQRKLADTISRAMERKRTDENLSRRWR